MGVGGQPPVHLQVAVPHEVLRLALAAEAELLELAQHERGEVVIENRGLDVVGTDAGLLVELAGDQAHLGDPGDRVPVVGRHHLLVLARALRGADDDRRRLLQVPGPLQGRHDQGLASVALLAAVEQVQRLDDPPAVLVVLQRDRLLVEESLGVVGRVVAVGHRHPAEVLAGGAGLVHVAPAEHGHPLGRCEQAERGVPAEVRGLGVGRDRPVLHAGAEAVPGPLVEGPVDDHDIRDALGHRHGRLLDRAAGRTAAVVDAGEELEVADAGQAGDLDLGVGVGGEGDHAVDLGGLDACVLQRGHGGLTGQLHLRTPGGLGELGGTDPGHGCGPDESHVAHGSTTSTLPVTWSPIELAPTRPTVMVFVASSLASTDPVKLMVSPG